MKKWVRKMEKINKICRIQKNAGEFEKYIGIKERNYGGNLRHIEQESERLEKGKGQGEADREKREKGKRYMRGKKGNGGMKEKGML